MNCGGVKECLEWGDGCVLTLLYTAHYELLLKMGIEGKVDLKKAAFIFHSNKGLRYIQFCLKTSNELNDLYPRAPVPDGRQF